MARTPVSSDAFFREVDDEVRRAAVARAARRWGVLAAVLVVVALIAFGATLAWRHHQRTQAAERGEALSTALSQLSAGNKQGARTRLEAIAKDGGPAYATLARMTIAAMAVQAGQDAEAAKGFSAIANDASAPQPLRDVALIRATALSFDTLPPAQVIARLKPLTVPGNPWFGNAAELTALAQIKAGRSRQAGTLLAAAARDPGTTDTLGERARQLAGDLGVDVEAQAAGASVTRVR